MEGHHGQIIELTIRKKGLNITEVARLSHVNRRTVYNWFNQKYVKPEVIYQLGLVLKHDFSVEFPDLFSKDDFYSQKPTAESNFQGLSEEESPGNQIWKDRYIALLEDYNKVLLHFTAITNRSTETQPA
jgi:transcriptional regulator with XRE-family HTH domain